MNLNCTPLERTEHVEECVEMMATSPPWSVLWFDHDQCAEMLAASGLELIGAFSQDELVGFMAVAPAGLGGEPLLEYLCVAEPYRGQGIGSALLDHFDEMFSEADNVYLFVSDINPKAVALYVRHGFIKVGELPDFNLLGQTEFLHRKTRRPRQEARRT